MTKDGPTELPSLGQESGRLSDESTSPAEFARTEAHLRALSQRLAGKSALGELPLILDLRRLRKETTTIQNALQDANQYSAMLQSIVRISRTIESGLEASIAERGQAQKADYIDDIESAVTKDFQNSRSTRAQVAREILPPFIANLPLLLDRCAKNPQEGGLTMEMIGYALRVGDETQRKEVNTLLKARIDDIPPNLLAESGITIASVIRSGDQDTKDALIDRVRSLLLEKRFDEQAVSSLFQALIGQYWRRQGKERATLETATGLADDFVKSCGLDFNELQRVWSKVHLEMNPSWEPLSGNVASMYAIEKKAPGGVRRLGREFGIRHFSRYPPDLLVQQVRDADRKDIPYGIILYPYSDTGISAPAFEESRPFLDKLFGATKGAFALRAVECGGRVGVAKTLQKLDKTYGTDHKISFAVVGGHGEEKSIRFGGHEPSQMLDVSDLAGRYATHAKRLFEDEPTIFLSSCSTGAQGGIAQELSRILQARVIAPNVPMSAPEGYRGRRVTIGSKGGKLLLNFENPDEVMQVYVRGEPEHHAKKA